MKLGELLKTMTGSDRIVVENAARQVIYRGYAGNAEINILNTDRAVEKLGIGMETYRKREKMWDWQKIDELPEQIPVEQFSQYAVGELEHILYIRIQLANEFMKR